MSVVAMVRLTAKPGRRDDVLALLAPALELTRAQPGCHGVDLMTGLDREQDVLLFERWESIQAHLDFIGGVIEQGGLDELLALLDADIETLHYAPPEAS